MISNCYYSFYSSFIFIAKIGILYWIKIQSILFNTIYTAVALTSTHVLWSLLADRIVGRQKKNDKRQVVVATHIISLGFILHPSDRVYRASMYTLFFLIWLTCLYSSFHGILYRDQIVKINAKTIESFETTKNSRSK